VSINYLDFDLLIERHEDRYRARVVNSPAGQATVDFAHPFSPLELENFVLTIRNAIGEPAVRRIDSPQTARVKAFGGKLFEAVFADEVAEALRSSLDEAGRRDSGLRLRLHLTDVPELADLPWEYLYQRRLNRFLARSPETPLIRYLDIPERIRPLEVTPPLKVLVVISNPSDYRRLDVEREWSKVETALGSLQKRHLVELDLVAPATLRGFRRKLHTSDCHILHFIGHGGFDEQAQDGVLVFEDDGGRGRWVSGQYLGELLRGPRRPTRLAILNACEGARGGAMDPYAGAAQSMVQQGIPAVIAMQFAISDDAAITFTSDFYEALADGYPVDASLAEARRAVFEAEFELEWATPVLYMRSPDGVIFDVKQVPPEVEEREPRDLTEQEAGEAAEQARAEQEAKDRAEQQAREAAERDRVERETREAAERRTGERAVRVRVVAAMAERADELLRGREFDRALAKCDEVLARIDASPELSPTYAKVQRVTADAFQHLGRLEEALARYDEVLAMWGDTSTPALRVHVAAASIGRGVTLDRMDRRDDAIAAFDDVVGRFADSSDPAVLADVERARELAGQARKRTDRRRLLLWALIVGTAALLAVGGILLVRAIRPGGEASQTKWTVDVPGTDEWTATPADCTVGKVLDISATGTVFHSPTMSTGPDGDPNPDLQQFSVIPNANHAGLIGSINRASPYFFVGGRRLLRCPTDGTLFLGVNDTGVANNHGKFLATITERTSSG
jgi:tetratricopeptide (TPR) repeat protein